MMPRRHPRVPSIGFASRHALGGGEERAAGVVELALARRVTSSSSMSGRNSCSGGSSSRTVTGRPSIASRIPTKSARWSVSSSSSAALLLGFVGVGEDEPLHERQPVAEEHVLGAAQADALGAEARAPPRRRAGRSALVRTPSVRNSSAQPRIVVERAGGLGRDDRHRADDDLAGRAVDRDDVAFVHGRAVDRERASPSTSMSSSTRRTPRACPCRGRRPPRGSRGRRAT